MPTKTRQQKRKRDSKQAEVETISEDNSDNEVTFIIKRPRTDSVGSTGTGISSSSSNDSGFKSNFSTSTSSSTETNDTSPSSATTQNVAVYYAKKSPAKQPPVAQENDDPNAGGDCNNCNKRKSLPSQSPKNSKTFQEPLIPSLIPSLIRSNIPKNFKGLTLDVQKVAQKRKVSNILEDNSSNKALPRRSPNGYLLPEPVPTGIILKDLMKNSWKVGKAIGLGGFGEIYSAELLKDEIPSQCATNFVIKVEPHSNGPLFVETNFYLRASKKQSIEAWKEEHGVAHLGVPYVAGSGSFRLRGKKFRFLVIPRYGTDLQTLLDQSESTLSVETACSIATQVVDAYEYIHSKGYVHKDCKGSNILFVNRGSTAPEVTKHTPLKKVCLVDFGLVSKYVQEGGVHKPYRIDERSAHEGTLEYTSRDAHLGCMSRRGDIEVILYCLIDWLGGKLPWDKEPQPHPNDIHKSKISAFQDIENFLEKAFLNSPEDTKTAQSFLARLMNYINILTFEEKPDYSHLRSIFQSEINSKQPHPEPGAYSSEDEEVNLAFSIRSKYNIAPPPAPISPIVDSNDDADDEVFFKPQLPRKISNRTPRTRQKDEENIKQRIKDETKAKKAINAQKEATRLSEERFLKQREMLYKKVCIKSLQNPTPIMQEQIDKINDRRERVRRPSSEVEDSPFRRSKFVVFGAKRARTRSLVVDNDDTQSGIRTPKPDNKGMNTPRSLQCPKAMQRRKSGAVKRLFNASPRVGSDGMSTVKILRRSPKVKKSSGGMARSSNSNSSNRQRHRSSRNKETTSPSVSDANHSGTPRRTSQRLLLASSGTPSFRRAKRNFPILLAQESFSKHVNDFSSMFNKALSNVTKSILRYNSKH